MENRNESDRLATKNRFDINLKIWSQMQISHPCWILDVWQDKKFWSVFKKPGMVSIEDQSKIDLAEIRKYDPRQRK